MNRFKNNEISFQKIWIVISSIFVIVLILFFLHSVGTMSKKTSDDQIKSLYSTVQKQIAQCYALEGTYPPNIEYLEEHYGLIYDKDYYYIDYVTIGSNLYPDFTIIALDKTTDFRKE